MSSYNPNIPIAGTRIDRTYQQISTNFTELNNQWGINGDHVELTSGTNTGKHKKSTYVKQSSAPTTIADEASVYSKDLLTGGVTQPEIYLRQQSNGTEFLMTRGAPTSSSGEGVLYGGLQIRSGTFPYLGGSSEAVTYSSAFPGGTVSVQITIESSTVTSIVVLVPGSKSAAGFNVKGNSSETINYIATGY